MSRFSKADTGRHASGFRLQKGFSDEFDAPPSPPPESSVSKQKPSRRKHHRKRGHGSHRRTSSSHKKRHGDNLRYRLMWNRRSQDEPENYVGAFIRCIDPDSQEVWDVPLEYWQFRRYSDVLLEPPPPPYPPPNNAERLGSISVSISGSLEHADEANPVIVRPSHRPKSANPGKVTPRANSARSPSPGRTQTHAVIPPPTLAKQSLAEVRVALRATQRNSGGYVEKYTGRRYQDPVIPHAHRHRDRPHEQRVGRQEIRKTRTLSPSPASSTLSSTQSSLDLDTPLREYRRRRSVDVAMPPYRDVTDHQDATELELDGSDEEVGNNQQPLTLPSHSLSPNGSIVVDLTMAKRATIAVEAQKRLRESLELQARLQEREAKAARHLMHLTVDTEEPNAPALSISGPSPAGSSERSSKPMTSPASTTTSGGGMSNNTGSGDVISLVGEQDPDIREIWFGGKLSKQARGGLRRSIEAAITGCANLQMTPRSLARAQATSGGLEVSESASISLLAPGTNSATSPRVITPRRAGLNVSIGHFHDRFFQIVKPQQIRIFSAEEKEVNGATGMDANRVVFVKWARTPDVPPHKWKSAICIGVDEDPFRDNPDPDPLCFAFVTVGGKPIVVRAQNVDAKHQWLQYMRAVLRSSSFDGPEGN